VADIERGDLEAWEVEDLPSDFEDRVMAAIEGAPAPRSRAPMWIAIAAAVVLGTAGVVIATSDWSLAGREDGSLVVALADGAKAFPEPGARIDVDGAIVRQSTGKVVYEVPSGVALVVSTDAGDVTVGGTRFEVEVMEMNAATQRTLMGAGAIAMGAIAVAVVVHEGSVTLANDHGELKVAASQRAYATDATAPTHGGTKARKEAPKVAAVARADDAKRAAQRARRDQMSVQIERALEARRSNVEHRDPPAEDEAPVEEAVLDKDYIRKVVKEQVIELVQECYNSVLVDDPTVGGKIVLNFTITGDESVGGVVEAVEIAEGTTLLDPEMGECVAESMASATFDPPKGGGTVEVTYPLIFEPGDE
jgi:hypothetical protein